MKYKIIYHGESEQFAASTIVEAETLEEARAIFIKNCNIIPYYVEPAE